MPGERHGEENMPKVFYVNWFRRGEDGRFLQLRTHDPLEALRELRARGVREVALGSQTHAIGFYERLGFRAHGPEYDDAGIPHRDMTRPL